MQTRSAGRQDVTQDRTLRLVERRENIPSDSPLYRDIDCWTKWTSKWTLILKPRVVFTDRPELQEEITGSPLVWVVWAPCPHMDNTSPGPHKRPAMRPPGPPPSPPPSTAPWVTVRPTGQSYYPPYTDRPPAAGKTWPNYHDNTLYWILIKILVFFWRQVKSTCRTIFIRN